MLNSCCCHGNIPFALLATTQSIWQGKASHTQGLLLPWQHRIYPLPFWQTLKYFALLANTWSTWQGKASIHKLYQLLFPWQHSKHCLFNSHLKYFKASHGQFVVWGLDAERLIFAPLLTKFLTEALESLALNHLYTVQWCYGVENRTYSWFEHTTSKGKVKNKVALQHSRGIQLSGT